MLLRPLLLLSVATLALLIASSPSALAEPNLALKKSARQSSTAYGGHASRAVDGNTEGAYSMGSVTHTDLDSPAWWEVDLGAEYDLSRVVIYNRTDCCTERLSGARLIVLSAQRKIKFNREVGSKTRVTRVAIYGVRGRYVRIQIKRTRKVYLSLAEVKVFGTRAKRR